MKATTLHSGLAFALHGLPQASTPHAGSQKGWREGEVATADHRHQASRGVRGVHTGPNGVQGWGGRASGLARGGRRHRQGLRGKGPGLQGAWERAGPRSEGRAGAGYRVVHPPHQDAEDRLAGPE